MPVQVKIDYFFSLNVFPNHIPLFSYSFLQTPCLEKKVSFKSAGAAAGEQLFSWAHPPHPSAADKIPATETKVPFAPGWGAPLALLKSHTQLPCQFLAPGPGSTRGPMQGLTIRLCSPYMISSRGSERSRLGGNPYWPVFEVSVSYSTVTHSCCVRECHRVHTSWVFGIYIYKSVAY